MKTIPLFTWLYDAICEEAGIRFTLFRVLTVHRLRPENIEAISEVSQVSLGKWNAYNFKSRLFGRCFLVQTKRGWFTRRVLITPKEPDDFVRWVVANGIRMSDR